MPALWGSKVTFVSVSQFWVLALCYPFQSVSGPFVIPCLIVSFGIRKKRKKGVGREERGSKYRRKKQIIISLLLTLNLFGEFWWPSYVPQEEGVGLYFSPF